MKILKHTHESRFSEILPLWAGETVVIMAGGPSLSIEQFMDVQTARHNDKIKAIAINNSYMMAPFADMLYFADSKWWTWHKDKPDFIAFKGEKCTIQNSGDNVTDETIHMLRNATAPLHAAGISMQPDRIYTGNHSGFQAINIAILAGAQRIILLGYDGERSPEGKTHWHEGHPAMTSSAAYAQYRNSFIKAQDDIRNTGVDIINSSTWSYIDTFRRLPLEKALAL